MADSDPHAPGETTGPSSRSAAGTPRWVKVFGIIALVLLALMVILLVAGSEHGPGRHF